MIITIKKLEFGYYHIRGVGPCNWAQPPNWPCSEEILRQHVFSEACEDFIESCLDRLKKESKDG
jgi:hypothetical protein